ncbi:MAG: TonB-dependent receptor [Bacteroidaceae bacterium]|nr:TonB-dependent receptor [Bacteroidaceae bacterium]
MNEKLNFRCLLAFLVGIFVSVNVLAQDITVKGHVKDAQGEPIIMGKVQQQGGQNVTVTDIDGNFTLKAPRGAVLVVSYMGFQTQEVTAAPNVTVVLQEDSKVLEEAVVIGYGKVRKADATGSVTAFKPDEMSKGVTTNPQDMIMGKIAGVSVISNDGTPGGGASIRIRGGSSLRASNDPLIVIDGLAIDNDGVQGLSNPLSMVNPEDIETFTVLKDASATAIYGSRASNGVIIITTKTGKKGSPVKVSYTGNVSLSHAYRKYEVLDGDQFRDVVRQTWLKTHDDLSGMPALGTENTNWTDQILRNAWGSDHQIGFTGAVKNMPYRLSVGFTGKNGVVETSKFQRFTSSLNLTPKFFNDHLSVNLTTKYMYAENRFADAGGAIGGALAVDPTQPVYDNTYPEFGGFWQNMTPGSKGNDPNWTHITNTNTPQNPLALLKNQDNRADSHSVIGNLELEYKIHGFEDLSLHGSFGGDYSVGHQKNLISPYSWGNNYYGWEGTNQSYKYNWRVNGYAQYQHNWNDKHNFDIMAGAELQHFQRHFYDYGQGNEWYDASGTRMDTPEAYSPSLRAETEHIYPHRLASYFARVNYSLLNRYLFTASIRFDGSSYFARGNQWGKFPAAALAWKINEEKFLRDVKAIDELKLRLGYGVTGQQDLGIGFYYLPRYTTANQYAQYMLGNQAYYTMRPEIYNPNIKWERTFTYNIGLDYSFLNGRIDGALDLYYRKTKDLISEVYVDPSVEFSNKKIDNIGSLRNKGVEFTINARPVVTKDFSWTIGYNVTWNSNELTELNTGSAFEPTGNTIGAGLSNQVQVNMVGHPINSFYVYQQVYDQAGNPLEGVYVDRNGDGILNADDKYVYKKPDADVTMGLTNKFIWKNWDFSFSLRASLNNYLYYDFLSNRANVSWSGLYSNSAYTNTTAEAVALGFQGKTDYYMSDYFVRNASFLRCDNITLGYSFNRLFSSGHYKGIDGRIYATVSNPFVISGYDGIDPERTHGSGVDGSVYPRPTTYTIGLKLNF